MSENEIELADFLKKPQKDVLCDLQSIIENSQKQAYKAVDTVLCTRNWLIGWRIAEEELKGKNRAEYGKNLIQTLSAELTKIYGKGFTKTNLYSFYTFYKCFPNIFHTVCGKFTRLLSWSHYRYLIQVQDSDKWTVTRD